MDHHMSPGRMNLNNSSQSSDSQSMSVLDTRCLITAWGDKKSLTVKCSLVKDAVIITKLPDETSFN